MQGPGFTLADLEPGESLHPPVAGKQLRSSHLKEKQARPKQAQALCDHSEVSQVMTVSQDAARRD